MPAATAATEAAQTFQPWSTTSTGSSVAENPSTEATDRSTNSPTQIVHSSAAVRNTSASWLPKIVWKVPVVRNVSGERAP